MEGGLPCLCDGCCLCFSCQHEAVEHTVYCLSARVSFLISKVSSLNQILSNALLRFYISWKDFLTSCFFFFILEAKVILKNLLSVVHIVNTTCARREFCKELGLNR